MPNPIVFPAIHPFSFKAEPKEQALKVLEEAAEIIEPVKCSVDSDALYEFADTLQAMGNLAYVMGWTADDIKTAYNRVKKTNELRGRYEVDNA